MHGGGVQLGGEFGGTGHAFGAAGTVAAGNRSAYPPMSLRPSINNQTALPVNSPALVGVTTYQDVPCNTLPPVPTTNITSTSASSNVINSDATNSRLPPPTPSINNSTNISLASPPNANTTTNNAPSSTTTKKSSNKKSSNPPITRKPRAVCTPAGSYNDPLSRPKIKSNSKEQLTPSMVAYREGRKAAAAAPTVRIGSYCVAFEEFVHKGNKNFNEWMRSAWAVDPKKVYGGFDIDNPAQDGCFSTLCVWNQCGGLSYVCGRVAVLQSKAGLSEMIKEAYKEACYAVYLGWKDNGKNEGRISKDCFEALKPIMIIRAPTYTMSGEYSNPPIHCSQILTFDDSGGESIHCSRDEGPHAPSTRRAPRRLRQDPHPYSRTKRGRRRRNLRGPANI